MSDSFVEVNNLSHGTLHKQFCGFLCLFDVKRGKNEQKDQKRLFKAP